MTFYSRDAPTALLFPVPPSHQTSTAACLCRVMPGLFVIRSIVGTPNDTIQPAAAKTACHHDRPDPPLGSNRLSGASDSPPRKQFLRYALGYLFLRRYVPNPHCVVPASGGE